MESRHAAGDGAGPLAAMETSWQLKMFSKSLKKQQKLRLLLRQLGPLDAQDCVLITDDPDLRESARRVQDKPRLV